MPHIDVTVQLNNTVHTSLKRIDDCKHYPVGSKFQQMSALVLIQERTSHIITHFLLLCKKM